MSLFKMLAIDLGASSGRGIIGAFDGDRLTLCENHRFPNEPVVCNGNYNWDILRIFHEIKQSINKAALDGENIASVGIDTWGVDYGYIGRNGALLSNPYHYRDARTDGIQEYAFARVLYSDIYDITGIQSMNFNTLYQILADMRDRPEIVEAADKLLFTPDLLGYFLTGVKRTEYTIASTGAILDAKERAVAGELLDRFGIPRRLFCDIVQPGTTLGGLLPQVEEETGAKGVNVVSVASHDTASAVIAVPATGEDFVYISSGTWSLMGVESRVPIMSDAAKRYSFTNEGGAENTIRFLKNIMGLWLEQESRRQWKREGSNVTFDELSEMAKSSPALVSLINPDDPSFSAPGNMPARIAEYCRKTGQRVPETMGETVRCIFESLALKYRATIETLEEITGKKYPFVNIVGGGTKEAILCQWAADACGRPVYAGPVEATAIGNIAVQAIAAGELKNVSEAREAVRRSFDIVEYEPHHTDAWDEAYERFKKLP